MLGLHLSLQQTHLIFVRMVYILYIVVWCCWGFKNPCVAFRAFLRFERTKEPNNPESASWAPANRGDIPHEAWKDRIGEEDPSCISPLATWRVKKNLRNPLFGGMAGFESSFFRTYQTRFFGYPFSEPLHSPLGYGCSRTHHWAKCQRITSSVLHLVVA